MYRWIVVLSCLVLACTAEQPSIVDDAGSDSMGGVDSSTGSDTNVTQDTVGLDSSGGSDTNGTDTTTATTGSLQGFALLQGGADHTGVEVVLNELNGFQGITDSTGLYRIQSIPPGTYTVTATLAGYAQATSAPFAIEIGEETPVPPLSLTRTSGDLEGFVLLDGETDHSGTTVTVVGTSHAVQTGGDGSWSMSSVEAGQYTILAQHPGYADGIATDITVEVNKVTSVAPIIMESFTWSGDFRVTDQASLDELKKYGVVSGYLHIEQTTDITEVRLTTLIRVGRAVIIGRNTGLTLVEIPNLARTGESVVLNDNDMLERINLEGLVTCAAGGVSLTNSPVLTSANVRSFTKGLTLIDVPMLTDFVSEGYASGPIRVQRTGLTHLDFLAGRTTIGPNLQIIDNPGLVDVSGLSSATSIPGIITYNNNGADVLELGSLVSLGRLQISGDLTLTRVSFPVLESAMDLRVQTTEALVELDAPLLKTLGALSVGQNTLLTTVTLPAVETLQGDVSLTDNPALEVFEFGSSAPLGTIATVTSNDFTLRNNASLTTFNTGLRSIPGALYITGNSALPHLDGFALLETVTGNTTITSNGLVDVTLLNLASIGGTLSIDQNAKLTNVSMPELIRVDGANGISISANNALTNVSMPMLSTIIGRLSISTNAALTVLEMPLLAELGESMGIVFNPQYPMCQGEDLRDTLFSRGWTGTAVLRGLSDACPCATLGDCESSELCCASFCAITSQHTLHCGACGVVCAMGELCANGSCVVGPRRVNVSNSHIQSDPVESKSPSISANGMLVAFSSDANLSTVAAENTKDIFVHDLGSSTTTYVSVGLGGVAADNRSQYPVISGDGSVVVFGSEASNLVLNDTNPGSDIFVHELSTGTITRISVSSAGVVADGQSETYGASVSFDGRYVAFISHATNLVSDDTNGQPDVFLHDRQTGTTERVSVASNGSQGDLSSYTNGTALSDDGRFVVFASKATNLVAGDTNAKSDIFMRDRQTSTTTRVSVGVGNVEADDQSTFVGWVSSDGRYVAFHSLASNLVAGDTIGSGDTFIYDRQTSTASRIWVGPSGSERLSAFGNFSPDGRYVAFSSTSTTLVSGITNNFYDVYLHDIQTGTTSRISMAYDGSEANSNSRGVSVSANGQFIAFESLASNLVPEDTNNQKDIFVVGGP